MASKWTIKSYNNAIREIRKQHPGLSLARARATWGALSGKLGRPASSVVVRNNSQDVNRAMRSSASKALRMERNAERAEREERVTRISSIAQWEDYFDDYESLDYDYEEINAGVDTGKAKK